MVSRILVVEDDPYLADLVATSLRYEGFETRIAGSGREALASVRDRRPDLLVLDVMLPDGSGLDTCRTLRRDGDRVPVVFLTARDTTEDKVAGLTVGGDDYLTKPFSLLELVARIRAVLRRTGAAADPGVLAFADLTVDEHTYEVRRGGRLVELTPTEYKLLRYLVANAGRVLSKRQIVEHVWEYGWDGGAGVVQTYVSYLRRKLDRLGPPLIHTLPRIGYVLRLPHQDD